jgi:hypothetical protein
MREQLQDELEPLADEREVALPELSRHFYISRFNRDTQQMYKKVSNNN